MLTGFINDVYDSVNNKIRNHRCNRLRHKMKSIVKKEYGPYPELFNKYYETGFADKLIDWIIKTSAYYNSNNRIINRFNQYNDYFIKDISQLPNRYISIIQPEYFLEKHNIILMNIPVYYHCLRILNNSIILITCAIMERDSQVLK